MAYEVDNALGLAQFVSAHLSEPQATGYLQVIEGITLDEWRASKDKIPGVNRTNRLAKESHIRDIVIFFQENSVDKRFLVENLALLPGCQLQSLELISYINSTFQAVNAHARGLSSRLNSHVTSQTTPIQVQPQQLTNHNEYISPSDTVNAATSSRAPPTGRVNKQQMLYSDQVKRNNKSKGQQNWFSGTNKPKDCSKAHPLKFFCLGIKSGADETVESLTAELTGWNNIKNLKVEAVSRSVLNTVFRVKFHIAASLAEKWKDPGSWPARILVTQWKGNPNAPLKPLEERQETRKIYLGNLDPTVDEETVTANVKAIYEESIRDGTIHTVKTHLNTAGWKREQELQSQNPQHRIRKSVCVVITATPGTSLEGLNLKTDYYPQWMRKYIRFWRGPIPRPSQPENAQPKIDLNWS